MIINTTPIYISKLDSSKEQYDAMKAQVEESKEEE